MPEQLSNIELKLVQLEAKIDASLVSAEKTRKYMFWSLMIPLALFVLPLLAIPFILPFLQTYLNTLTLPAGF
jgi:hypothetical protein